MGSSGGRIFHHVAKEKLVNMDETLALKAAGNPELKLTRLAHGGGCGCKLAPNVLSEILTKLPMGIASADLLVGREGSDDAAVYRLSPDLALVATVDFFMPIVDDPFDFGRIAASNALSDIYAMGGRPLFALAIVGMPVDKLPREVVATILSGGEEVCRQAGIPIAGGHSIDCVEPVYGLCAIGAMHPEHVKRNSDGRQGDVLVLGKPLGVGVMSAALRKGALSPESYRTMVEWTTKLNDVGPEIARIPGVHAMTDVTGFSLLGHLLEVCRGSGLKAEIELDKLPFLPEAPRLSREGYLTGASRRNWESCQEAVTLPPNMPDWLRGLLCDPQTSGGLLVSCRVEASQSVCSAFHAKGFTEAAVIGRLQSGRPGIVVKGDGRLSA